MEFEVDIFTHLALGIVSCLVGVFLTQDFRKPVVFMAFFTSFLTFYVFVPVVAVFVFHYLWSGMSRAEQQTIFKGMIVIGGMSGTHITVWVYESVKKTSNKRMTLWEMIHEIRHGEKKGLQGKSD